MRRASAFLRRHTPMMLGVLVFLVVVVVLWILSVPIAQWSRSALGEHFPAVAMVGGCLVVLAALIWLPKWQAARPELTPQARFEVENEARKTLAEIIGGAAVLAGLLFTWENLRITQETATRSQELTREGQITERFTKAIDQLGAVNDKGEKQLEIRLGGIYALERIARDSPKDHWPIMEILTAYVRENAPRPLRLPQDMPPQQEHPAPEGNPTAAPGHPSKLATDIQAVLTVLERRDRKNETAERRLDLRRTDLHNAQLSGYLDRALLMDARLEGAELLGTRLRGADLTRADFRNAYLNGADFRNAYLDIPDLKRAFLRGNHQAEAFFGSARLEEAHLEGTSLEGARLEMAFFGGARLEGARLKGAINLTVEQLAAVRNLHNAHLDPPLLEQIQQKYPHLLEKPQD